MGLMVKSLRLQPSDNDLIAKAREVTRGKVSKIGVIRRALEEYINRHEDNGGDSGESR